MYHVCFVSHEVSELQFLHSHFQTWIHDSNWRRKLHPSSPYQLNNQLIKKDEINAKVQPYHRLLLRVHVHCMEIHADSLLTQNRNYYWHNGRKIVGRDKLPTPYLKLLKIATYTRKQYNYKKTCVHSLKKYIHAHISTMYKQLSNKCFHFNEYTV